LNKHTHTHTQKRSRSVWKWLKFPARHNRAMRWFVVFPKAKQWALIKH